MALQSGIPVSFEAHFPRGAFMVGEVEAVVKWSDDGQRQGQDLDKNTALTAYENDRDMLRRANAAIATLASQGRAVGFIVFACLQDPRKETLPARGLFTQTVGLRLRDRTETAMVLGEGAVAAGAACHEISPSMPGTAYVLPEDGSPPQRVRAAYAADEQIRDAALTYFAPHPRPIVLPATDEQPKPRRTRSRRANANEQPEES